MALDLAALAPPFFNGFEESVTLVPPTGDPYEVDAVLDRDQPGPTDLEGTVRPVIIGAFRNDAELGIPLATFNPRTWRVQLPLQVGQSPSERKFMRMLPSDAGVVMVEIA